MKKKYFKIGTCLKCGCCCENIYVRHNGKVINNSDEFENIKKIDPYSFYKHIEIVGKDDFGLIFTCNKFDKTTRTCLDHKNRPSICKKYPSEEIFSFGAKLEKSCGYRFEPIESFEEIFLKVSKKPVKKFKSD